MSTIDTNSFAFEIKFMLGLDSAHPGCQAIENGLNGPMTNRVQV